MPERPALLFAPAQHGVRPKPGQRGRATLRVPPRDRQSERLEPRFQRIAAALDAQRLVLSATPDALEPETILVLEIAGEVTDFARAMRRVPGLEFLGEQALDQLDPDEDFAAVDQKGTHRRYARQLFLIASDARAWREVLSMWQRWKAGKDPERPLTPFRDLFAQLLDLREWSDRDRLERGGAAAAWQRDLAGLGDELVPFEAELWLRANTARRASAMSRFAMTLETAGGTIGYETVIEEIDYHGLLGRAPAAALLEAARSGTVSWLATEGVRLFHATGQMAAPGEDDSERAAGPDRLGAAPTGRSRIAILDGLPVAAHEALDGRVRIDDPDAWGDTVPSASRNHGTLMASLVVHGDLGEPSDPLHEPVYLRPILRPDAPAWVTSAPEILPSDRLPVDLVHEVVAHLFEGSDPAAPDTRVLVLAVGDASQQFDRFISPLARLLDWLSWRYDILFLVSAGNHPADLFVPADVDLDDAAELEHKILDALRREALFRRLLAPAESLNALTVGAAHDDASGTPLAPGLLDPLRDRDLPNVVTPVASGVNRAIKPDILLPGGRQPVRSEPAFDSEHHHLSVAISRRPPGLRVAAPGIGAELDRYVHSTGTSPATGLAGHTAGVILSQLDALRAAYGQSFPGDELDAVLVKAALAHTARWGAAGSLISRVLGDAGEDRSRARVARFLGHGRAQPKQALVADDHRAVLIHAAHLSKDATHTYELPLPESLRSVAIERRLIVTLAWLTPTLPRHRLYRAAALELDYNAGRDTPFGDRQEADHHAAGRGTLQHEILLSRRAVPYATDATTPLRVACRATTGVLDDDIPYAIIATIDTPVELRLPIYEQVRDAIAVRVPVTVRARS